MKSKAAELKYSRVKRILECLTNSASASTIKGRGGDDPFIIEILAWDAWGREDLNDLGSAYMIEKEAWEVLKEAVEERFGYADRSGAEECS
jgi:hypothetical protein